MSSKSIKDAINDLGRFFGIRSADSYLESILDPSDVTLALDPLDETQLSTRGMILNAISGGSDSAPSVAWILKHIETAIGPGVDNPAGGEKIKSKIKEMNTDICITPSSATVPFAADPAKHPVNAPSVETPGGPDETQGLFLPEEGDYYTVDDFRAGEIASDGPPLSADAGHTPVHVIQVFPAVGNVAQSDTDVVSLFMNGVPTLELSRATPFIDVMVVSRDASASAATKQTRPLSLGRWMLGRSMEDEDESTRGMYIADDINLTPDPTKDDAFRTTATMEIFTSPQTMIPINKDGTLRMWNDSEGTGDIKPRDPFRPMLSLIDLNINVAPAGGMHTYKTADMKVVLHDRAMLGSVSPLVSPQERGSVNLILTYGWSHPDGSDSFGAQNRTGGRVSDADSNRWGDLIDSMRVTETYAVVNSDYSFTEDGQVDINMKLAMVGAASIDNYDITLSEVSDSAGEVNEIFAQIKSALTRYIQKEKAFGKVNIPSTLRSATNMSSANNMEAKDIKALKKWLAARTGNAELSEVHTYIQKVFGDGTNVTAGGELNEHNKTLTKVIVDMCEHLRRTPDPFLREMPATTITGGFMCNIQGTGKKGAKISTAATFTEGHKAKISEGTTEAKSGENIFLSNQNYVSLGKIFTYFVGEALSRCGDYKEIQIIFYAFNDSSSHLFDYNIAQFPIPLNDFTTMLTQKFNLNGNMSLSQFMSFVNRYFLRDQGAPGYGFSAIYGDRKEGKNSAVRQLNKGFKDKGKDGKPKQSVINSEKKNVIATAYGLQPTDASVSFKLPQITMKVETIPMRDLDEEGSATDGMVTSETLLRIHVMDQKCSTTSTLLDLFNSFAGSGVMSGLKRNADSLRGNRHGEVIANQLNLLQSPDIDVISPLAMPKNPPDGYTEKMIDSLQEGLYHIKVTDPSKLKNVMMQISPSLIYGGLNTSIHSARLASLNNPALMSVNMLQQQKTRTGAEEGKDSGLPQQVVPTSLDLETAGCPFINFGQEYFVDLGSNSTADNFYAVVGISHKLGPGSFTTSVKMINRMAFGRWSSTLDNVKEIASLALQAESDAKAGI